MARYQVILAYDGTDFSGFQRQAKSIKSQTVQGVVEAALQKIGWNGRSILAAGRTDSGVHASGQVIAFDLDWTHSTDALQAAMNANLPPAVAVRGLSEARPDFHPRYDALARCYRYHLYCQPIRNPLQDRFSWHVWPSPDFSLLQEAAALLLGEHDFAAFGTPPRTGGATTRYVQHASWQQTGDQISFEIHANAYLYHMARRLVNIQVEIGLSRQDITTLKDLLDGGADEMVQGLAPPHGLVLEKVLYP